MRLEDTKSKRYEMFCGFALGSVKSNLLCRDIIHSSYRSRSCNSHQANMLQLAFKQARTD